MLRVPATYRGNSPSWYHYSFLRWSSQRPHTFANSVARVRLTLLYMLHRIYCRDVWFDMCVALCYRVLSSRTLRALMLPCWAQHNNSIDQLIDTINESNQPHLPSLSISLPPLLLHDLRPPRTSSRFRFLQYNLLFLTNVTCPLIDTPFFVVDKLGVLWSILSRCFGRAMVYHVVFSPPRSWRRCHVSNIRYLGSHCAQSRWLCLQALIRHLGCPNWCCRRRLFLQPVFCVDVRHCSHYRNVSMTRPHCGDGCFNMNVVAVQSM